MGCLQLVFALPSSFFFGVVAPLDLAKTDYPVPGPALHNIQDFHWLLGRESGLRELQFALSRPARMALEDIS
jgi:hypothetical protein